MNNLITNFDQILKMAQDAGLPPKKRGIIREYLQAKFISHLYTFPKAEKLSFIGGTALRLLRGLPRFSEDLDFDNLGLDDDSIRQLVQKVADQFALENIEIELKVTQREYKNYFELKFPQLLQPLNISNDPREKLMIKVDYSDYWQGQQPEVVLFKRYGFIEQIVSNPLNQVLVQKLTAYVQRKRTQPRDMLDIVWLYGQGAELDQVFIKANNLSNLTTKAKDKFSQEGVNKKLKQRLKPFLFNEDWTAKLDLFGQVLQELG